MYLPFFLRTQHFTAYKDAFQNICYLEKGNVNSLDTNRRNKFEFFIADKPLKKIEVSTFKIYFF